MGQAYLTRMPSGIAGEVTRGWSAVIEPANVTPSGTTGAPTAYGVPVVIDQTAGNVGNARTVASPDAAANVYGVLVRPFPTQGPNASDPLGTSTPPTSGPIDILRQGYVNVLLSGSAAAVKGAPVYIWSAASSGTHILGGWEAASPGGSGFQLTGAFFMGPADASGNTEINFNQGA